MISDPVKKFEHLGDLAEVHLEGVERVILTILDQAGKISGSDLKRIVHLDTPCGRGEDNPGWGLGFFLNRLEKKNLIKRTGGGIGRPVFVERI